MMGLGFCFPRGKIKVVCFMLLLSCLPGLCDTHKAGRTHRAHVVQSAPFTAREPNPRPSVTAELPPGLWCRPDVTAPAPTHSCTRPSPGLFSCEAHREVFRLCLLHVSVSLCCCFSLSVSGFSFSQELSLRAWVGPCLVCFGPHARRWLCLCSSGAQMSARGLSWTFRHQNQGLRFRKGQSPFSILCRKAKDVREAVLGGTVLQPRVQSKHSVSLVL